jgi:hypothetical protein
LLADAFGRFPAWRKPFPRQRTLINGLPPYTPDEVRDNGISINVNFLEGTKLAHDARRQFYNAFLKPGRFFSARTDYGPKHKRQDFSAIVSREVNRIMKRSPIYFETFRSKFALNVLHGIGPAAWDDRDCWCPDALGIEDVLVPSNTLLTLKNLPFFAIYRSYTAHQLSRLIHGPKVDSGWRVSNCEKAIEWVDQEAQTLMGTQWPEIWSPEKMAERVKSDGGLYASDAVPTIDCYDFYFWNDDQDEAGWNRRIVLDAFQPPGIGITAPIARTNSKGTVLDSGKFLYNPGKRKYGSRLAELISFQFADLSAVAPFRYHSVRSLGWLLYAVCHLQNRLRCKFNEAVFEGLMMYMRVSTTDEAERALKVELISRGIIDETVKFVPQAERWQVNQALAEMGMAQNAQIINENSIAYRQGQDFSSDHTEKTKFQVMAEVNAVTALVSSGLIQAYRYQGFEYEEIFRRFCKTNSRDADVREFRNNCLKQGVPEKILIPEAWTIEPEQVMGAGNKTLEMAIAEQLMQYRNLYDPEPQRKILRDVTMAITDDPARADDLVPQQAMPSAATEDAQRAAAVLLAALPMVFKSGVAHGEYAAALLKSMQVEIGKIAQLQGNMATQEQIMGLLTIAGEDLQGQPIGENGISFHLKKLGEDPEEKQAVKQMGDVLGKMLNEVKGFEQRLMEQQQKAGEQAQMSPEAQAKVKEIEASAKAKRQSARESHGMKTAQKQVAFEQKQKQDAQSHQMEMAKQAAQIRSDVAAKDLQTAAEIRRGSAKAASESETAPEE